MPPSCCDGGSPELEVEVRDEGPARSHFRLVAPNESIARLMRSVFPLEAAEKEVRDERVPQVQSERVTRRGIRLRHHLLITGTRVGRRTTPSPQGGKKVTGAIRWRRGDVHERFHLRHERPNDHDLEAPVIEAIAETAHALKDGSSAMLPIGVSDRVLAQRHLAEIVRAIRFPMITRRRSMVRVDTSA